MKLLYCHNCYDIFALGYELKFCACKKCSGKYIDKENAVYNGNSVCIGIDNNSLRFAVENQMIDGAGVKIDACVIPFYSGATIRLKDDIDINHFSETHRSFVVKKDWDNKINNKRSGIFYSVYKLCKKIMEIKIKKKDEYDDLTTHLNIIYKKIEQYLKNNSHFEEVVLAIEWVGVKDQSFIKNISSLSAEKIVSETLEKYKLYYDEG